MGVPVDVVARGNERSRDRVLGPQQVALRVTLSAEVAEAVSRGLVFDAHRGGVRRPCVERPVPAVRTSRRARCPQARERPEEP
ncbi:hypothetical protein [Streptomyces sp. LUP47B]|uniref:hypothetical protein n=1 Tax=Streptomyces sp. LUP47B TaxID=1890286 RepID=UPI00159F0674|nr:hypothetical protein [Streptomyces sp. LUP47B]